MVSLLSHTQCFFAGNWNYWKIKIVLFDDAIEVPIKNSKVDLSACCSENCSAANLKCLRPILTIESINN